jgi:hypothetical protein
MIFAFADCELDVERRELRRQRAPVHVEPQVFEVLFISHGLGSLIVLFARLGRADAAAKLNGTLSKTFEHNPFVPDLAETLMRLRGVLGDARFDAANRLSAAMALHETYEYAVAQVEQALATTP